MRGFTKEEAKGIRFSACFRRKQKKLGSLPPQGWWKGVLFRLLHLIVGAKGETLTLVQYLEERLRGVSGGRLHLLPPAIFSSQEDVRAPALPLPLAKMLSALSLPVSYPCLSYRWPFLSPSSSHEVRSNTQEGCCFLPAAYLWASMPSPNDQTTSSFFHKAGVHFLVLQITSTQFQMLSHSSNSRNMQQSSV
ncbi:hypothetical protein MA16_Dca023526 [Dendrobium catenatum]|uniref:Uncharacterized protein n=1 Tax=Dendrobium catenatum TaxID=906689 RepID=A0A2I0XIL7_9ASPA|nr:hypothetical protein MA16_Dca023526 [Dendrobium catenatum]